LRSNDVYLLKTPPTPTSALFPYTTLFRSLHLAQSQRLEHRCHRFLDIDVETFGPNLLRKRLVDVTDKIRSPQRQIVVGDREASSDRKSTRLNSSHDQISYAVFCLKKKNKA